MTPQAAFFSVAKFGGSDSLSIRQRVLRVRIRLAPPFGLGVRRLPVCTRKRSEKFARFRGVLAVGFSRIRTGDGGFGASKAQQPAFFSVGKFGGSDSLSIRPSEGLGSADRYSKYDLHSLRA